jgi:hypothetical protein
MERQLRCRHDLGPSDRDLRAECDGCADACSDRVADDYSAHGGTDEGANGTNTGTNDGALGVADDSNADKCSDARRLLDRRSVLRRCWRSVQRRGRRYAHCNRKGFRRCYRDRNHRRHFRVRVTNRHRDLGHHRRVRRVRSGYVLDTVLQWLGGNGASGRKRNVRHIERGVQRGG